MLEQLYKQTPMEDTFGINAVALVDGQPRTLWFKQMLEVFLGHRLDVVRRRGSPSYQGRRPAPPGRGPADGILDIDEVIQLIRSERDAPRPASA